MAIVSFESNVHEAGEPTMSVETSGSSEYTSTFDERAASWRRPGTPR